MYSLFSPHLSLVHAWFWYRWIPQLQDFPFLPFSTPSLPCIHIKIAPEIPSKMKLRLPCILSLRTSHIPISGRPYGFPPTYFDQTKRLRTKNPKSIQFVYKFFSSRPFSTFFGKFCFQRKFLHIECS